MALYSISGVGCCGNYSGLDMSGIGRRTKQQRKQRKAARRYGENCKGRTAAKFAPPLIIGRRAFLTLIRLNAFNWGKKMVLAFRKPEAKIKIIEKWCSLGGNSAELKKQIAKTEEKLIRKGKINKRPNMQAVNGIGEVATSTLLATALPIITALMPILKRFLPEEVAEGVEQATEAAQSYAEQSNGNSEDVSGLG